jgi:2-succinyl-5-enolpyruvyl-6-hydroxy-3-cyclohexene-1-carboxylate synthase
LVLAFIFGPNATVHKAVHSWLAHIQSHELLYTQQLNAYHAFGCKILVLIDRAVKLYFREYMHTNRQARAAWLLMFTCYQGEIIMNTFNYMVHSPIPLPNW